MQMIQMDFTPDMAKAMFDLADKLSLGIGLTRDGRIVMESTDPEQELDAVAVANSITDADFPFGYVVPETDTTLVFEF